MITTKLAQERAQAFATKYSLPYGLVTEVHITEGATDEATVIFENGLRIHLVGKEAEKILEEPT